MNSKGGGDDGWVIPKSTLITLVMLIIGSIGGGGYYMGVQATHIERLDDGFKGMERSLAEITNFITTIKARAEYDASRNKDKGT